MKMDLKHFKKLHSNDKSTTFVHKNGHKIVVAHSGVDEGMRKQLTDLPKFSDGGDVTTMAHEADIKRHQVTEGFFGKEAPRGETKEERETRKQVRPAGGMVPSGPISLPAFAEGGKVQPPPTPIDPDKAKEVQDSMRKAFNFDEGTGSVPEFNLDLSGSKLPPMKTPLYQDSSVTSQAPYSDKFGYEAPTSEQPQEAPLQNVQIPSPPTMQQNPMTQNMGMQAANLEKNVGMAEHGLNAQASAEEDLGAREVNMARQQQVDSKSLQQHFQEKSDAIDNERKQVYEDLKNGHIEPNHFVQSMGGFQKGMTAIGLVLSGMGSGLAGQSNIAMDFLNKQIDRDIEGQKAEMGKKENLLSHLNQQFGNLRDATTMAKALQSDMYAAKMLEVAAQSKDPMAKARAEQAVAQLHFERDPQVQQMKMSQALLQGSGNGQISPEILVQHSPMVPEHQKPEMAKQLGKVRALEGLRGNMNESFDQISNKVLNGAFSPNDTESAKQAFTGKLVQLSEGRYNYEAAQNLTNAMFPGRTDTASTVASKKIRLDNLIDSMAAEPRSILQGVGINVPKSASSKFNKR